MKNLSISLRLKVLVVVMSLLLVAVGVLGLQAAATSIEALRSVYEGQTAHIGHLAEISRLTLRSRLDIANSVLDPTPEQISKSIDDLDAILVAADKQWKDFVATELTTDEKRTSQQFDKDRAEFIENGIKPAVAALKLNDIDATQKIFLERISPLYLPVGAGLDALVKIELAQAKDEYAKASRGYENTRILLVIFVVFGLGFSVIAGWSLISGINRSLNKALDITNAVANGDLAQVIDVNGHAEVSKVLQGLSKMQESLAQVVGAVRQVSQAVATSSAEIAQGNMDLSDRTENQASALQQTASSMYQLGSQVRHNAECAQMANKLSMEASSVAVRGGDVVAQVVDTMKEINESSRKISDIIGVIDSIAFQTNILALNAAVEAARAGEQGRGFAVVASEVRSLAGRSADAAKEIKRMINASVERVEHGTALVDHAGETMNEVVTSIRRVADIVGAISSASQEQSVGVAQVGEAVSKMDQFTQQNAALVEESAAGANALNEQALEMVQAVAVFNLGNNVLAVKAVTTRASVRSPIAKPSLHHGRERRVVPHRAPANAHAMAVTPGQEQWESY
ncbi:MAG: methyl-accepting chemotaxis protein [Rhodoferax sp.]|uniref:methyl-accepting chemotaxis protein n=1 Tax=Rhodoferax sp. TaxID=50421 RepID=UPI0030190CF0